MGSQGYSRVCRVYRDTSIQGYAGIKRGIQGNKRVFKSIQGYTGVVKGYKDIQEYTGVFKGT